MTVTINAVTSTGLVQTSDGSGIVKLQSNGVATNALAWANYNGVAGTLSSNYNISSVTKVGTGIYQFNFTNAMSSTPYSVVTSYGANGSSNASALFSGSVATRVMYVDASQLTTSFTVRTGYSYAGGGSAYEDAYSISIAIFGN